MVFMNSEHQAFYNQCISKANAHNDPYRQALFYTFGLSDEIRRHINDIYSFTDKGIVPDGLNAGWQTNGSVRVTRLAFNLYNGFDGTGEGCDTPARYTPDELFCDGLLAYMFEAVKLRFPEYYHEIGTDTPESGKSSSWLQQQLEKQNVSPKSTKDRGDHHGERTDRYAHDSAAVIL